MRKNEKIIIALSGRKGAGKNTIANAIREFFSDYPVGEFSFADTLKDFCIETLGLRHEQCYGSDEEKNSPTQYLWENVKDDFLRWKFADCKWAKIGVVENACLHLERKGFWNFYRDGHAPLLKNGAMTGREIMQLFGTELVRETFGNVWADATIRRINKSKYEVAIITDNRFPNEIESVLSQSYGFIIRLTRSPYGLEDQHPSEKSLDGYNWKKDRCFVIDNAKMSIDEQNVAIKPILEDISKRSI